MQVIPGCLVGVIPGCLVGIILGIWQEFSGCTVRLVTGKQLPIVFINSARLMKINDEIISVLRIYSEFFRNFFDLLLMRLTDRYILSGRVFKLLVLDTSKNLKG